MRLIRNTLAILAALLFSVSIANAGEKWDMALAYGAGNFLLHTQEPYPIFPLH